MVQRKQKSHRSENKRHTKNKQKLQAKIYNRKTITLNPIQSKTLFKVSEGAKESRTKKTHEENPVISYSSRVNGRQRTLNALSENRHFIRFSLFLLFSAFALQQNCSGSSSCF